jgi:hypothetical protein
MKMAAAERVDSEIRHIFAAGPPPEGAFVVTG